MTSALEQLREQYTRRASRMIGGQIGISEALIASVIEEFDGLLKEKSGGFQPKDRDDGKYVARQFGKIAEVLADEAVLFLETGQMTRAGMAEAQS
jgi:hypothetical protein